jgi:hypothetical protein
MDEGTRPIGDQRQSFPWPPERLSAAIGVDRRNIGYYRQGRLFPFEETVMAILGPAEFDTPERQRWRRDVFEFYRAVEQSAVSSETPTHEILAARKASIGEKSWSRIGTASPHKNGFGLNLKIDLLPVGNAEIVLRKIDDDNPLGTKKPEPVD